MRDPEAPQVGPGAVARLQSQMFIKRFPPRRTRCRARMRDPEALQVGPGAVARLRSPILIIIPIPFPGSGVSYLPPEGGWTSFRVRPIVKGLRRGGRGAEPE